LCPLSVDPRSDFAARLSSSPFLLGESRNPCNVDEAATRTSFVAARKRDIDQCDGGEKHD
jgi:hypothetical protein